MGFVTVHRHKQTSCIQNGKPSTLQPPPSEYQAGNLYTFRMVFKKAQVLTTGCAFMQIYKTAFVTERKLITADNTEGMEWMAPDSFQRCTNRMGSKQLETRYQLKHEKLQTDTRIYPPHPHLLFFFFY